MGQTARIFSIILTFLMAGCQSIPKSPLGLEIPPFRPIPTRIFIEVERYDSFEVPVKSEEIISDEIILVEQFYKDLGFKFEIKDIIYIINTDQISLRLFSSYYSDSLNIFYMSSNASHGYSDFPWEFPATTQIYSPNITDWKLLAHEIGHAFSLRHVHYTTDYCEDDGCSDTELIPLNDVSIRNYPNIMTYSLSDYYFITPQQKERMLLWYKIRFIYKVYDNSLSCPIEGMIF